MHIIVEKKSLLLQEGSNIVSTDTSSELHSKPVLEQWHSESLPAPVTLVGATGSVLDDAWKLLEQDALPVWASVIAMSQNAGRGQTRRSWFSPAGNLYAAIRLPAEGAFLTTAAAPALSTLLLLALQSLDCPLQLKWPNDLVSGAGRYKVGGILLEERKGVLMAGIGINVCHAPSEKFLRENYAFPAGILPQTSTFHSNLDNITIINKSTFAPENSVAQRLWLQLVSHLYFWYKKKLLIDAAWKDFAESFLLWKGQAVELNDGHENIRGILQGMGNSGEILIIDRGQVQQCTSGSLRLC